MHDASSENSDGDRHSRLPYSAAVGHHLISLIMHHVSGVAVQINFLYSVNGALAQVAIDGSNVAQVSTLGPAGCVGFQWTSGALLPGQHTLTLSIASFGAAGPFVDVQSFTYVLLDQSLNTQLTLIT